MILEYENLKGRTWIHGVFDCYSLIQDFYAQNYQIVLNDYDHEDEWWNTGQNLYMENFAAEGFGLVDEPLPGDVILMQINAPVPCHGAIYLGKNTILHHYIHRISNSESYKGVWRNTTVAYLRHRDVKYREVYDHVSISDLSK